MTFAEDLLVLGGVINLVYGFITGFALALIRQKQAVAPKYLMFAHIGPLMQGANDVEVEVAGGGDPPLPQSLARLQADFDANLSKGGRDGTGFAIEADGLFIGQCALFNFIGQCALFNIWNNGQSIVLVLIGILRVEWQALVEGR